ncbi:putative RNA-directed DNA polymerase from transposon X-element [Stylophora pistillata]|uniref:Putative RNA-directed DNA polymerase from transposon X-element n=1 Tax=Stylophora pistillata TaxID=50429 RepID=A0A2B4RD98_STYPI|nr:putative RNA-directed DNA polymerase from transposon X-element [Stylophora pistillata]
MGSFLWVVRVKSPFSTILFWIVAFIILDEAGSESRLISGKMVILNEKFDNSLMNKESEKYQSFSKRIAQEVEDLFKDDIKYYATKVIQPERDSVKVYFELEFKRIVRASIIISTLKYAAVDGKFGSFNVDPSSITVLQDETPASSSEKSTGDDRRENTRSVIPASGAGLFFEDKRPLQDKYTLWCEKPDNTKIKEKLFRRADQIPAKYIKMSPEVIASPLTHVLNNFISEHSFPDAWKIARVSPIPKVDNPVQNDDFSPISIVPALSKVYERFVLCQLLEYMEMCQIYRGRISSYRKGHSTSTVLLRIRDIINAMKKDGNNEAYDITREKPDGTRIRGKGVRGDDVAKFPEGSKYLASDNNTRPNARKMTVKRNPKSAQDTNLEIDCKRSMKI